MHVMINTLMNTWGASSEDLQNSLSVQRSSPHYSVLWTLAALISLDCQLHLLSSGRLLGYLSLHRNLETAGSKLEYSQSSLCFLSLRDHTVLCCVISSILKIIVSYSLLFFFFNCCCYFWQGGISAPCFSILVRCRILKSSFLITTYFPSNLHI